MPKVLVVVDMQNDFVSGVLGTKYAQEILPNVVEKVKTFDGEVIFTLDTHGSDYLTTQEGRLLPVKHCIGGTEGHRLSPELEALAAMRGARMFEKDTFGSRKLAETLAARDDIEEIELVGVCTDICVVSNALLLKAFMPEQKIAVDCACCAGVSPDAHTAALDTMRSCQIEIR